MQLLGMGLGLSLTSLSPLGPTALGRPDDSWLASRCHCENTKLPRIKIHRRSFRKGLKRKFQNSKPAVLRSPQASRSLTVSGPADNHIKVILFFSLFFLEPSKKILSIVINFLYSNSVQMEDRISKRL